MKFALAWFALSAMAAERYAISMQESPTALAVLKDEAGGMEASVAPGAGGELCGLRYKFKDEWVELIYRACDYTPVTGWRGKAPLLWPAVGATTGGYTVAGKKYAMPQHGFVQSMRWKLDQVRADGEAAIARVVLSDNEKTREMYPYGWQLAAEYRLAGGKLTIAYTVVAAKQNRGRMPFSIGNHIGFRTPLLRGSDPAKMDLVTAARKRIVKDDKNIPTGATTDPPFRDQVALGDFAVNPAIGLTGYETNPSMTLTDPQGLRVRMSHQAERLPKGVFVQYNMWGAPRDGYFCPEPWVGLQNGLNLKQGLIELAPGEKWAWTIEIEPSVAR